MRRLLLWIALGLIAPGSATALAGTGAGTESPFAFGAGSRELALGGSNLSTAGFAFAPFWNPARLARAERFSAAGFHTELFAAGATYQYVGLVAPTLDFGTFGLGVFRLGVGDIEIRDAANQLLGTTRDSRLAVYLAYGRRLRDFDVGVATRLEHHALGDYKATSSPGLNVSISRSWLPDHGAVGHVTATLQAQNLVRPAARLADESVNLPYTADLGLTVGLEPGSDGPHRLSLSASLSHADGAGSEPRLGLEYAYGALAQVRMGLRDGRFSAGAGVGIRGIEVDYALVGRDLGTLHTFTLSTAFGTAMSDRRLRRAERREAEFNTLMQDRLSERNRELVAGLLSESEKLYAAGTLQVAFDQLDRALFLARSSGLDTTRIADLLTRVRADIRSWEDARAYEASLDSARMELTKRDYLAVRFYAQQALSLQPGSADARALFDSARTALQASEERDHMIRRSLLTIDSLIAYGRLDQALQVARSVAEVAPDDRTVESAMKRVRFETLRVRAADAFASNDFQGTLAILDSALVLFPGHAGCVDMQARARQRRQAAQRRPAPAAPPPAELSGDIRREVERLYAAGQEEFAGGELQSAVNRWEEVERLAPDFQSVRAFLVKAYKFIGVDRYGKNRPEDAVRAWRRAAELDPENPEIASYIRRTEGEIRKLKELSYEP